MADTSVAICAPSMDTAHSSLDNKLRLDDWYLELSQNTVLAVVQSIDHMSQQEHSHSELF